MPWIDGMQVLLRDSCDRCSYLLVGKPVCGRLTCGSCVAEVFLVPCMCRSVLVPPLVVWWG